MLLLWNESNHLPLSQVLVRAKVSIMEKDNCLATNGKEIRNLVEEKNQPNSIIY